MTQSIADNPATTPEHSSPPYCLISGFLQFIEVLLGPKFDLVELEIFNLIFDVFPPELVLDLLQPLAGLVVHLIVEVLFALLLNH